jgi:hypothetical protein
VAEWQTQGTQNPPLFYGRVGSTPTSGTRGTRGNVSAGVGEERDPDPPSPAHRGADERISSPALRSCARTNRGLARAGARHSAAPARSPVRPERSRARGFAPGRSGLSPLSGLSAVRTRSGPFRSARRKALPPGTERRPRSPRDRTVRPPVEADPASPLGQAEGPTGRALPSAVSRRATEDPADRRASKRSPAGSRARA